LVLLDGHISVPKAYDFGLTIGTGADYGLLAAANVPPRAVTG
jgi:hypothetical protein